MNYIYSMTNGEEIKNACSDTSAPPLCLKGVNRETFAFTYLDNTF
jgi:hypothetical protein